MRKRLLKKYLSFFGLTLKAERYTNAIDGRVVKVGEVCFGPKRRYDLQSYLPPAHPLARRRKDREGREWARALPALLKAGISDAAKRYCAGRVDEARQAHEGETGGAPVWVEQGSKPRLRLYSVAGNLIDIPIGDPDADPDDDFKAWLAEIDRRISTLLCERPQVLGKRLQSGNRVKLAGRRSALTTNPKTPNASEPTP